jgi:guanosine-3',5'-bis(diphosphate) 3'-pyrophosphohydrolase
MTYNPTLIRDARAFAFEKHEGQERSGGQPYIVHPHQVAEIVSKATKDENIIAAAWLHDTVEDCGVTYEELTEKFGQTVSDLVKEVTCVRHETKGKIFPNLETRDGIMLKLADRLSNISGMEGWTEDQKQVYLDKTKFWKNGRE